MVPPGRVTSTLTSLLIAIAPSYAALPMHCVYVCGNCNLTPMVLCDANEACGPGQPACPAPYGAPGDQSSNEATKETIEKPGVTARTKHFETWMQYCRERVLALEIVMQWIPTSDMLADIFTKCLDKTTFLKLRDVLLTEIG